MFSIPLGLYGRNKERYKNRVATRLLTEDGECEQKVLEHLGADFGTFGLRPGLNGLQVTLVHPHLNLFRHTVGTVRKREKEEHMKHLLH